MACAGSSVGSDASCELIQPSHARRPELNPSLRPERAAVTLARWARSEKYCNMPGASYSTDEIALLDDPLTQHRRSTLRLVESKPTNRE